MHKDRHQKLRELLKETAWFLIEDPTNLYYHTGLHLSAGQLLIGPDGAHLWVDGRYFTAASALTEIQVKPMAPGELKKVVGGACVGLDSALTSQKRVEELAELGMQWKGFPGLLQRVRQAKEAREIAALRRAAALSGRGFDAITSLLREGVTERQLVQELEIFWLRQGGERPSFDPTIAFGEHTALPHHTSGERPLKVGDPVLIDIGVQVDSYQSDMTRTLFFGAPTEQMREIYEIVERTFTMACAQCGPGVETAALDQAAHEQIDQAGYKGAFCHRLGHGVGLEVHEMPAFRPRNHLLEPGMVITIEPGLYIPGRGGVRIEDTLLITNEGAESLTCRPHTLWSLDCAAR